MHTETYYVEKIGDVTYVRGFSSETTADEFFTEISNKLSFSDCTGIEIPKIIWQNERIWYFGVFTFGDMHKNIVWEGCFPEWTH